MSTRWKNLEKDRAVQDLRQVRKDMHDFLHGDPDMMETVSSTDRPSALTISLRPTDWTWH